jgi:hypothetical protein
VTVTYLTCLWNLYILCNYSVTSPVCIRTGCAGKHSQLSDVNTVVFGCRLNYQPSNCKLSEATTSERLQPGNTRISLSDARSGSVPPPPAPWCIAQWRHSATGREVELHRLVCPSAVRWRSLWVIFLAYWSCVSQSPYSMVRWSRDVRSHMNINPESYAAQIAMAIVKIFWKPRELYVLMAGNGHASGGHEILFMNYLRKNPHGRLRYKREVKNRKVKLSA